MGVSSSSFVSRLVLFTGREGDGIGRTLELDFVLNDQGLALVLNLLRELGRDGVVSGGILDDETLVANHAGIDGRLLDSPFTDVGPFLFLFSGASHVLLGMGRLPPLLPVPSKLLEEVCLQLGGLRDSWSAGIHPITSPI